MTGIDIRALDRELKRRRVLAQQKETWEAFVEIVRRITGDEHA